MDLQLNIGKESQIFTNGDRQGVTDIDRDVWLYKNKFN